MHNGQHKMHEVLKHLHLTLKLTLGTPSYRAWLWEKLSLTNPSEIPELVGYIGQLWFDALHHPLEQHKVAHTK